MDHNIIRRLSPVKRAPGAGRRSNIEKCKVTVENGYR